MKMSSPKKQSTNDDEMNSIAPLVKVSEPIPSKLKKNVVVNPLDCHSNRHLNNSALVYKVLAKVGNKIFLQRNLLFRKRSPLPTVSSTKRPQNLKRKFNSQILNDFEPSKRRKLDKLLDKSGTYVKHEIVARMQIILKDINDETRIYDDVDVEAFILKMEQSNNCSTSTDGIATHKIGTFKIQGNSQKKTNFPSLPLTIDVPPEAFVALNGHVKWSNWLLFRCTFNTNDERQLRRLGHRKSSEWQNTPSVVRMSSLPLCESGITPLTDGDFDLKFLWKFGKTDEQLIETIRNVLRPCHRSSLSPPIRVNGKNDHDSLYMKITVRWLKDVSPTTNGVVWPTVELRRSVDDLIILKGLKQKTSPRKRKSSVPSSIVYRFVCAGSKNCAPCRMQTVADDPSSCPFCNVWAEDLYFLLKHLRCCHFRFTFHLLKFNEKHIIEVRPNNNYDSTDEIKSTLLTSCTKRKCRPTKNSPAEKIFWIRRCSKKQIVDENRSLDEFKFFAAPESPNTRRQKSFNAHKRRYYHSQTCMPLTIAEFENDSENELAADWLEITRTKMIEEFSDVNLGEKKIMSLWNSHLMKYNYVGDNQIYVACKSFWEANWNREIYPEYVGNYIVHVQNLFASGVLTQQQLFSLATQIKQTKIETDKLKKRDGN